ncbi:MAG: biotin-dependent carboxyltransferase family protein [Pseudomonadota bacterium]
MEVLSVLQPGAFTTVQDLGRFGYQRFGIPISGSLDKFSHCVANWLVGNSDREAVIEMTFTGPKLEVLAPAILAVTGAPMQILVNNVARSGWEAFSVRPGDVVSFRTPERGVRSYLAVSGGIDVPEVMGSRSTYVAGKLGGYAGRSLSRGDVILRGSKEACVIGRNNAEAFAPPIEHSLMLRAVPGPQDDLFDTGLDLFFSAEFTVSPQADRMGCRLTGPCITHTGGRGFSIISEPGVPGAVQVPPEGSPIVLFAEQTAGGYAKIACVVTPDLDVLAQAVPGDRVRFLRVDPTGAHTIHRAYRERIEEVRRFLSSA